MLGWMLQQGTKADDYVIGTGIPAIRSEGTFVEKTAFDSPFGYNYQETDRDESCIIKSNPKKCRLCAESSKAQIEKLAGHRTLQFSRPPSP